MKTSKVMIRTLHGVPIHQEHKTGLMNANDLLKAYNENHKPQKMLPNYLRNSSTEEIIAQVCSEEMLEAKEVLRTKTGKYGGTWMHPIILVDFAMWLSPEFKYHALSWLRDELLASRDNSGDSFKLMNTTFVEAFPEAMAKPIAYAKIASKIASMCRVGVDKDKWQTASEEQLKLRDAIQNHAVVLAPHCKDPRDALNKAYDGVTKLGLNPFIDEEF